MSTKTWHEGAASIIILPGGEDGAELLNIVDEWTRCWMLKPAFWVRNDDVSTHDNEEAKVVATIVARNARKEVDLLDYLSGVDLNQVRLIALRTVNSKSEHDQAQDRIVDIISDTLSKARPYNLMSHGEYVAETHFMKINLVFAPSMRKGASYGHLLESSWDINLVVAPEDRSTPSRFDKSTRDSNPTDKAAWLRFLISNTAVAAGIWAGQDKSIFEAASQFTDLSPVQGQVRVMRSFVRGILSEGLSTRIAADALTRAANAETSAINPLRPFPNQYLESFESDRLPQVIDDMVSKTLESSNARLTYKEVELTPEPPQDETGVVEALKYFFKTTWNLIKVLPIWFFAAIWNRIAIFFSRLIFGNKGRKRIVGAVDFPRTNLDKFAEAELEDISNRRERIKKIVENWPINIIRKSEPLLWSDMRKLMIGRLDASTLPNGVLHETGTSGNGKLVIGDLNSVLPNLNERWDLPADIERTIPSQTRSTNWQEVENIEDLENFLNQEIGTIDEQLVGLASKSRTVEDEKSRKESELAATIAKVEKIKQANLLIPVGNSAEVTEEATHE
jgi:hypothetical protein